jgi:hypothetical protein
MGSSHEFGPSELGRVVSSLEGRRLRRWGTLKAHISGSSRESIVPPGNGGAAARHTFCADVDAASCAAERR